MDDELHIGTSCLHIKVFAYYPCTLTCAPLALARLRAFPWHRCRARLLQRGAALSGVLQQC